MVCAAAGEAQRAPLTLVLNGVEHGVVMVILTSDDALVAEKDLIDAGVPRPAERYFFFDHARYVSIASLAPRVTYSVDLANLLLKLQADPKLLPQTTTSLGENESPHTLATAVPSGFINYTISDDALNPVSGAVGFVQAGAGDAKGLLLASASYSGGSWRRGLVAFQRESQAAMRRVTFGDEVASTSMLGGSAVIGGFGLTRHFEFQPTYSYFPTPGISGTALGPVTADVFVNGNYLRSVQLPPGQFNLTNLQVPSGANLTQVILHDTSGATTTLNGIVYQTQQLLAKGVTDYNYHVGFLRPNVFGNDDEYQSFAALGNYRVGLTDHLTVGARLEKTSGMISGGPQLAIGLPMGELSVESGWSSAAGAPGSAFGAAYSVQFGRFAFNASGSTMSGQYATASLDPNAPRTRSSVAQSLSFPVARSLSVVLSHTTSTFTNAPSADQLAASLSTQFRRGVSLSFSAERDRGSAVFGPALGPAGNSWSIGVTASFKLSRNTSLVAQSQGGSEASFSSFTLSKSAPNGPGFGYIVNASDNASTGSGQLSSSANLSYQTQYGDVTALLNSGAGASSARMTLSGSLIGFGQGLFFARPVSNAYTLADVGGFPGFLVFVGEGYQGRTDGRGDLVVPVLHGYDENHVRIDEAGALDVTEDQESFEVDPKAYQGVVARFGVRIVRAYAGKIVVHVNGADRVPAFAHLTLTDRERTFTTDLGSNGQFYFDDVPSGSYRATLAGAGNLGCEFALTVPHADQAVTELGPFACEAAP